MRVRIRPAARPRAALRGLVVVTLATLGSLFWAPSASAHDELLDLQPGNKVVVSTPPTRIELVFGAAPLTIGTQIRVTDPKGDVVSTGPVTVDGGTVVEKLTGNLVDGVYRVDWRVTASDGHPVSGTYTFTLKSSGAAPTSGPVAPSSSVTTGVTTSAPAQLSSTALPASGTTSGSGPSGSGPSAGLVVGLAAVVALVAGTVLALLRRRRDALPSKEGNPVT